MVTEVKENNFSIGIPSIMVHEDAARGGVFRAAAPASKTVR